MRSTLKAHGDPIAASTSTVNGSFQKVVDTGRATSLNMTCFLSRTHSHHALVVVAMAWCFSSSVQADTSAFAARAVAAKDNRGQMFAVVDKTTARVSLYDASGKLMAASPVLLGQAKGDASVPGIGERPMADIAPHERTTPAGRFKSEPGKNLTGESIVWIDYDAAVSMHRLRPSNPLEKRPERMATATPSDNRITYGCVNIPADFYDRWVLPTLGNTTGVVYVLPETKPAKELFSFLR